MKTKTVLIPTDFSEGSQNAANYAISLFEGERVRFVLLNSYRIVPVGAGEYVTDMADFESHSEEGLKQGVRAIENNFPGKSIDIEVVSEMGYPVSVIDKIVKEKNIDLVVMGTKGASGLKEALIGSITADTIKTLRCPVLAVPENTVFKVPEIIAFAADFREIEKEEVALNPLMDIAKKFHSEVLIVHVEKAGKVVNVEEAMQGMRLHDYLDGVPHQFEEVKDSDAAEGIEKFINTREVDMLVTVARRHSFWESLFSASITGQLAMHSHIPLLALQNK